MSQTTTACCASPLRVPGEVDRVIAGTGLRLRHIPGEICLHCHDISSPVVEPSAALREAIDRCVRGNPISLTIVKARPDPDRRSESVGACPSCSGELEPALLDVGLGEHLGLVVEDLRGGWCWRCSLGSILRQGEEMRERLTRFGTAPPGPPEPSLLYDTPAHPRSVQFEITTRCNLRCDYCTHRLLPEHVDIGLEQFREILERIDLAQVDNVDFTGLGEAVMHPGLPAMVRMVRERAHPTHLRVVTNGTIMAPKRYEALCDAGITTIAFSIDSLDPEVFARNRGGARLDIVLRNLESLVEYRERRGLDHLQLRIKSVLLDGDPFAEAERILQYSSRLGLMMPHFSCLDERADVQYEQTWLQSQWARTQGERLAGWADARWRELTLDREPPPASVVPTPAEHAAGFIAPGLPADPALCRWAVDAIYVGVGGEALACCEQMIDIPRHYWGSFRHRTMSELWNDELFWGYRLPLALGRVPKGCVGCSRAPVNGIPMPGEEAPQNDRTMLPVL